MVWLCERADPFYTIIGHKLFIHVIGHKGVYAQGGGAPGEGSPVAPGGRMRQNTRMLPLRSWTSLYSRRFSSTVFW